MDLKSGIGVPLTRRSMPPDGEVPYIIHRVHNVTGNERLVEENAMRREESIALTAQNRKIEAEILQHIDTPDEKNRELQYANAGLMQYAKPAGDEARSKDDSLRCSLMNCAIRWLASRPRWN